MYINILYGHVVRAQQASSHAVDVSGEHPSVFCAEKRPFLFQNWSVSSWKQMPWVAQITALLNTDGDPQNSSTLADGLRCAVSAWEVQEHFAGSLHGHGEAPRGEGDERV